MIGDSHILQQRMSLQSENLPITSNNSIKFSQIQWKLECLSDHSHFRWNMWRRKIWQASIIIISIIVIHIWRDLFSSIARCRHPNLNIEHHHRLYVYFQLFTIRSPQAPQANRRIANLRVVLWISTKNRSPNVEWSAKNYMKLKKMSKEYLNWILIFRTDQVKQWMPIISISVTLELTQLLWPVQPPSAQQQNGGPVTNLCHLTCDQYWIILIIHLSVQRWRANGKNSAPNYKVAYIYVAAT